MVRIKDLVEKYGNREVDEVELEKILKRETICDLEDGDTYWFINPIGQIYGAEWSNEPTDICLLRMGNVFLTREDAEFKVECIKVKAELNAMRACAKNQLIGIGSTKRSTH